MPLDQTGTVRLLDEFATDRPSSSSDAAPSASPQSRVKLLDEFAPVSPGKVQPPAATSPSLVDTVAPVPSQGPGQGTFGGLGTIDPVSGAELPPVPAAPVAPAPAPVPPVPPVPAPAVSPLPAAPVMTAPSNMPTFDTQQVPTPPAAPVTPSAPAPSLLQRVDPMSLADAVAGQTPGVPGVGALTYQPPDADTRPGFWESVGAGGVAAMREGRRMGQGEAFATDPPPEPDVDRTFMGNVGFGIGHSSPALAGGFLGAAGGTAAGGPLGGVLGGGLGFGAVSAAQALIPAYDQARRGGLDHDAAVDYAIRNAAATGAIGAATAPLFAWAPFKGELSNILLHTFTTGPGVSIAQKELTPRLPGQTEPSLTELGEAGLEGAATGAAVAGGHVVGRALTRPPEIPTVTVTGHRETPPDQAGRAQLGEGSQAAPAAAETGGSSPLSLPAPETPPAAGEGQQVAQGEPTPSPEDVRIGRGGEQLPPPVPGLPVPSSAPAPPGATPGQGTPSAPVPSPQPAPPDTGAGDSSSPPVPAPPEPAVVSPVPGASGDTSQAPPTPPGPTPSPAPTPEVKPPEPTPDTTKTEGSPGSTREVSTPGGPSLPTEYQVVEADTLKQATGALQPRDRAGRVASEAQIAENAARLDPSQITTSPVADYGAPVVMPDGTVLAGNGRLAAINRAAELHPERYDAYKEALTNLGHDVSTMQRPVLVRRTGDLTPEQARQFAEASNTPRAMSMSPVEQAKVDARNLTDDALAKYDPAKPLTAPANRGFMRDWMQSLAPTERARLLDAQGNLSQEGLRRVQGAVLAKAYDHDPILKRALESPVDDVKSVTGSLMDVAAPYVKLKSQIAKGNTPGDLDITRHITDALDLIHQAREKGIAPGDMLKQGDIFGGARLDPITEQIVRTFYNDPMTRLRSRPQITRALQDYVEQALAFRPGKDLFGNEVKADPADMLRQAREGKQGGLGIAAENRLPDQPLERTERIQGNFPDERALGYDLTVNPGAGQLGRMLEKDRGVRGAVYGNNLVVSSAFHSVHEDINRALKLNAHPLADTRQNDTIRIRAQDVSTPGYPFRLGSHYVSVTDARGNHYAPDDLPLALRRILSPDPTDGDIQPREEASSGVAQRATPEEGQLARQDARIAALEAKGARITPREARALESLKNQRELLQRTSNRFVRKGRKLSRKPVSPHNPKPFYAPRDPMDYHFRDGEISVYRTAFADAGYNPDLAINYPLERQIDILTRQSKKQFGLRDVTVDPNFDKFQLRSVLLDLYRAGTDMMATLSYPTDGLGLAGTLALHLEPYVRGVRYTGQWSLNSKGETTIKIVGSANSLGHEWTHALDYWLADKLPTSPAQITGLTTAMHEQGDMAVPRAGDTVAERFVRLLHVLSYDQADLAAQQMHYVAISQRTDAQGNPIPNAQLARDALADLERGKLDERVKESAFRATSRAIGKFTSDPDYYPMIEEILARSSESYLSRKMLDNAVDPRGVVMPDEAYTETNDKLLRAIYPNEQDRIAQVNAWDDLHTAIRNELFTGSPSGVFSNPANIVDFHAITQLQKRAPIGAINALRKAARETMEAVRHPVESWRSVEFFDPTRPKGPRSLKQRSQLNLHQGFSSMTGLLEAIHAFAPEKAKPDVMRILRKVGLQPGTGEQQPVTFEERAYTLERDWSRRFLNILSNNDLTPKALREKKTNLMLRHALVTGDATYKNEIIPANIAKAAGQIRRLQDEVFKSNRDAGLDIQYAKNGHFTRIYDQQRIWGDPDGFTRDASKLFKKMFDDDVGDDPEKLYQRWLKLTPNSRRKAGQGIQEAMKQLGRNLAAQRAVTRNLNDPHWKGDRDKAEDRLDELKQAAQDIHDNFADGVGDHVAQLTAQNWTNRVTQGYPDDFDAVGPSGNYLNHRVLPPEADTILEKWMHNDVTGVMMRYYRAAARKQAYNELFGEITYDPDTAKVDDDNMGKILENDLAEAIKHGLHGQDVRLIRDIVQAVTGKAAHSAPRLIRQAAQVVQAYAATTMLGRATLSMAPEPLVSSLVTGNASAGLRAMHAQMRGVLHKADAVERQEFMDLINVTRGPLFNDAMLRVGGTDYADTPMVGRFTNYFYDKVAWMTPWDQSSRRAAGAAMHWFLQKSANDYLRWKNWTGDRKGYNWARADTKGDRADRTFNELGIDPDPIFRKKMMEWLGSMDGLPDPRTFEQSPFADDYALAMNRLVRRAIQDVMKADTPLLAQNEWLGLTLQFGRYLYSFNRNVLQPMFGKIHEDTIRAYARAQSQGYGRTGSTAQATGAAAMSIGNAMITTGIYLAGVALAALASMALFSPDVLEKEYAKDDFWTGYFLSTVLARSGLTGPLGIPQQALNQIKYRDGLSGLATGPGIGNVFNEITALGQWLMDDTPANTNTRGYNGLVASYKLLGLPLEAYILTKIAGGFGPVGGTVAWVANMFGSSRAASEWFASTIAGDKGSSRPGGGSVDEPLTEGTTTETDQETQTEGDAESAGGGAQQPSSSSGLAGQAVGLVDDFASPISRFGASAWNLVPPPLRPALLAATFVWGGWQVFKSFEDYTEPPAEKRAP